MVDVSIIIPIYNGKKYLEYLFEIITRNLKNYELEYGGKGEAILVNDYPEEKVEASEKIEDIYIYNLDSNRGIHGARVFGYFKAKGDYIVFLDQDDRISEDYLVRQKKCIGMADAVVCNGYVERLCIRGRRGIYTQKSQLDKVMNISNNILKDNIICSPGQVLLKKTAVPKMWLTNIVKANGADDFLLWILMIKNECTFCLNTQHLYTHVEYGENTSSSTENMNKSIKEMIKILERNDILSPLELQKLQKTYHMEKRASLNQIIKVYDYWVYLDIRNQKVSKYFYNHGYNRIAIYGMNYIGNRLYDELNGSEIKVEFGIDQAADEIEYDIPILNLNDAALSKEIEKVDAVIVTAITFYQGILQELQNICHKTIISLEDIFLEMIREINQ